ncbi:hypothetical protein QJS04_geneDACA000160 [Acorus gramineus]|uniref:Uncharacterized protein n=1 Tax=Acorus gramineus TaxID=55184 RepID=A0AAV9AR23_ACOGR|nr:hypothetical protein QJS04_geneDACA000160 [Acorus gramineus]
MDQTVSWDHVPQIATPSADFHRRMNASYQTSNSSSLSLGLSLPMKPDELVHPIKNFCMGFPELRYKLDNVMTYGEKQYHSTYHASSWSEGELDSLWIGVRRHGLGNWQTMLKDRKLCFPEWRVAGDLARQWEEEKIKLLDGSQVQPAASLANVSFRNQWVNHGSNISSSLGIQTSAPETRLSLGNIYFQRDRNILERYPFQLSKCDSPVLDCYKDKGYTRRKPRKVGPRHRKSSTGHTGPAYLDINQGKHLWGHLITEEEPIRSSENGGSIHTDHRPDGTSGSCHMPWWLKEAFAAPTMPSYKEHQFMSPSSEPDMPIVPPKEPPRSLRKSNVYSKFGGLWVSDALDANSRPDVEGRTSNHTGNIDMNQFSAGPNGPIVIESDASSEETISDDHCSRL